MSLAPPGAVAPPVDTGAEGDVAFEPQASVGSIVFSTIFYKLLAHPFQRSQALSQAYPKQFKWHGLTAFATQPYKSWWRGAGCSLIYTFSHGILQELAISTGLIMANGDPVRSDLYTMALDWAVWVGMYPIEQWATRTMLRLEKKEAKKDDDEEEEEEEEEAPAATMVEQVQRWYKGFFPHLMQVVLWRGTFAVAMMFRPSSMLAVLSTLVLAKGLTYPFSTIQLRMLSSKEDRSTRDVADDIMENEGWENLYQGALLKFCLSFFVGFD